MWVVGYADIFLLSKFVSDADLGTYHLASKAAFLVAVLPGGFRKALRPLQKTAMFQAVEKEYGVGTARGTQFGYFWVMLAGTMLATTVMATVMVRVAPPSYAGAAPLIPLVAGGLVAPTVYRMTNKSVKYADKRVPFIIGAVVAMFIFVGLCLVLIPELGVDGAPLAMMGAFLPPTLFVFFKSQRGRSPIILPWRSMFVATFAAVAVAWAHALLDPGFWILEILAGIVAILLWCVLCIVGGAIPKQHRGPLLAMVRGLRDRGHGFEPAAGLSSLRPRERKVLRRAVLRGMPPERAARPLLNGEADGDGDTDRTAEANALLVDLLRRTAVGGGASGIPDDYEISRRGDRRRDARIGAFLFAAGPIAGRDQIGKRLVNDGVAEPFDLHTLEAVIGSLQRAGKPVEERWRPRRIRRSRREADAGASGKTRRRRGLVGREPTRTRRRPPGVRPSDDDLVGFDGDLDRAMAGPVLGVDGVVLDGRVEPEPVALVAVVEARLDGGCAVAAAAAASATAAPAAGTVVVVLGVTVVIVVFVGVLVVSSASALAAASSSAARVAASTSASISSRRSSEVSGSASGVRS